MYGKDGEKMIPPVRIHGRKWDVEEWSMFKEIRDERAFNGILNQIIENIQNGSLKAGAALPAERTMAEIMGVSRPAVREALRALELLGIVKSVPGGGNYITEDLDTWLIEPLSILFKLNNGYLRQNQQFRAALEREAAILAARKCTPLDAAELWVILARLDAAEDEKVRGELDRELHKKIAKIADNPMVYSVLAAADQLTENIVSGTRDYIMKKNNSAREVDDQHHRLVEAIINGDAEQAERCMSEHMDTIERYMEEMQKNNVISIIKHFPGHGITKKDSHILLPYTFNYKEVLNKHILPFKEAIDNGCDGIMISHIVIRKLTQGLPSSLSKKLIKEYLREKLHYDNLVITDDIRMKPVDLLYKSVSLKKAFTSGADIILFKYRKEDYKVINKVIKMVKTGKIKEEDIDKSVTRILRIKEKYNISDKKKINGCNIEELNKQIEELNSILN